MSQLSPEEVEAIRKRAALSPRESLRAFQDGERDRRALLAYVDALLDALELMLAATTVEESGTIVRRQAEAAIAAARGES